MNRQQRTLAKPVSCSGLGVHSGRTVQLNLFPAPLNYGIQFLRADLPERPVIPALFNRVVDTSLATVIGYDGCIVSTIEHLMATFSGLSIDNARVEIDSYELPIMDGSAAPFVQLIRSAGLRPQGGPKCFFTVTRPLEIRDGDKFVGVYPHPRFKMTCAIEFPHPLIGRQVLSLELTEKKFARDIAPARTFGFLREVEAMKRFGLARVGSLDNAVVIGPETVMNAGGLRFPDEFVRHKFLDCLGDFSLIGLPIVGHVQTERSGHAFNQEFVKEFFMRKDCWETQTVFEKPRTVSSARASAGIQISAN